MKITRLVKIAAILVVLLGVSGMAQARDSEEGAFNTIKSKANIIECKNVIPQYWHVTTYAFNGGFVFSHADDEPTFINDEIHALHYYKVKNNTLKWIWNSGPAVLQHEYHIDSKMLYIKSNLDNDIDKDKCKVI